MYSDIVELSGDHLGSVKDLFEKYRSFYRMPQNRARSDKFVADRFENNQSLVWVAIEDGDVVGFVQVYFEFSSLHLTYTWVLNDLFVDTEVRGSGHGYRLTDTVVSSARMAGADEVVLETESDNTTARALYDRYGFVTYKEDEEFVHYRLGLCDEEDTQSEK